MLRRESLRGDVLFHLLIACLAFGLGQVLSYLNTGGPMDARMLTVTLVGIVILASASLAFSRLMLRRKRQVEQQRT